MFLIRTSCLQEVYEYVFSTGHVDGPFTLFSSVPREQLLPTSGKSLQDLAGGIVNVENRADSPDPWALFGGSMSEVC